MPSTARRKKVLNKAKAAVEKEEDAAVSKKAADKRTNESAADAHEIQILNPAQAVLISLLKRAGWRILNLETLLEENDRQNKK